MPFDNEFCRSMMNLQSVNGFRSNTYWPIGIENYNRAGDKNIYHIKHSFLTVYLSHIFISLFGTCVSGRQQLSVEQVTITHHGAALRQRLHRVNIWYKLSLPSLLSPDESCYISNCISHHNDILISFTFSIRLNLMTNDTLIKNYCVAYRGR